MAQFRYSQTIFLRFTVTLFHNNLDKKIMSNEQKLTSNEQKVTSHEQKVASNEENVTSNEQNVTSNEQKVTSNEQKVQPPQGLLVIRLSSFGTKTNTSQMN